VPRPAKSKWTAASPSRGCRTKDSTPSTPSTLFTESLV
jgi:hypothetical protein